MKKTIVKKEMVEVNAKHFNKYNVKSIDELLGIKKENKKLGDNLDEYTDKLKEMNIADLQNHCVECDIVPKFDRDIMIRALLQNYQEEHRSTASRVEKPLVKFLQS